MVFNSKESIMTTTPFRRKLELLLERLRPYLKKTKNDHVRPCGLSEPIHYDDNTLPYFIIGDDAFATRTWLMHSYPRP